MSETNVPTTEGWWYLILHADRDGDPDEEDELAVVRVEDDGFAGCLTYWGNGAWHAANPDDYRGRESWLEPGWPDTTWGPRVPSVEELAGLRLAERVAEAQDAYQRAADAHGEHLNVYGVWKGESALAAAEEAALARLDAPLAAWREWKAGHSAEVRPPPGS